jgi:hypothetical protein
MAEIINASTEPVSSRGRVIAALCSPIHRIELFIWCLVAIAMIGLRLSVVGGPELGNDSYQYLSVANNFSKGQPGSTSIIHFDTERSHGKVPAPLTTFPLGYSTAIATLSYAGVSHENAGMLISAAAILSLLFLYYNIGHFLNLGGMSTRFLFLWTISNFEILTFSTSVATEAIFTAITTGAVLLFVFGVSSTYKGSRRLLTLVSANVLIGLAYWVRYAGLFLYIAVIVYVLSLVFRKQFQTAILAGESLIASTSIIVLSFIRNLLLVHDWRGGNDKFLFHPIPQVLKSFVSSIHHLISGNNFSIRAAGLDLVLFISITIIIVLFIKLHIKGTRQASNARTTTLEFGLCFIAIYCSAILYLGITSVISFDVRMFVPLVPVILIIFSIIMTSLKENYELARHQLFVGLVAVMSCSYVALNIKSVIKSLPEMAQHQVVRSNFAREITPGRNINSWIGDNVRPTDVIVATRGQATGYILQRPTISLVSLEYSNHQWDEDSVKSIMQNYHAKFLILYAGVKPELYNSVFLSGLLTGTTPPWLVPEVLDGEVKIYRFNSNV